MATLPTGTITFLLTDIEGSTRLLGQLGDAYRQVLADHHRLLREALTANGGVEVGTEGDAFFVVFTNAPAAVAAATRGQQALAEHPWPEGAEVRVRMGLHTGEGVLGGDDYTGIDLHRAARIAGAGHGGQVLLSAATQALVAQTLPEGVTLRDLGEHRLRDLEHPEHVFQLVIPGLEADFPPIRTLDARRGNLPRQLTTFVGRDAEVAEVRDLLSEHRLVTLTGPGGAGKTRLSLEVARTLQDALEDGAFFVPLAPISDPELVVPTIAQTLGVDEDPARPTIEPLIEHLQDRETLLVLDNFEQVIPAASAVGQILAATGRVKVLTSSRESLSIAGEQEFPVPPLGVPDPAALPPVEALSQFEAVRLFVDRATSVKPGFRVTNENASAIAEICARLDGLPLAIELAAARVKLLAPDALLKRLEHRLSLLAGGPRDVPQRQQTLRDAIAWSFDLLEEEERALFARLSVFVGGFTLEAAEIACNPEGELGVDTLDAVASLVNKSLLRQAMREEAEDRFTMLQTIREFAWETLGASPEVGEIRERHARHFLRVVEEAVPHLFGPERARWLDLLAVEHDNLRAAIGWALEGGDLELGLRLGGLMWRFWQMRGHLREGREWLTRLLRHPLAGDRTRARADSLEGLGGILYWMGDEEAAEAYEECLALRRELGDPPGIGEALYNRACMHVFGIGSPQDSDAGLPLLEEALGIFREIDDPVGVAKVQWVTGSAHLSAGDYDRAEAALSESVELNRKAHDLFGEAWGLHMLGVALVHAGRADEALPHFHRALEMFLDAGDRSAIPVLMYDFAIYAHKNGDDDRALLLLCTGDVLQERTGVGLGEASLAFTGLLAPFMETVSQEERATAAARAREMSEDDAVALARETAPLER